MSNIETAIIEAWQKVRPTLYSKPRDLERRMKRRRGKLLTRPPRAWCLAIRATDTRLAALGIGPAAGAPRTPHEVRVDAWLLRRLCKPVTIAWPGETWDDVAKKLGVGYSGLVLSRVKGLMEQNHVQGLGGRRGNPVPILYTDRKLDPAAREFWRPDPAWEWTVDFLLNSVPDDFEQVVQRIPKTRTYGDWRNNRSERPNVRLPPPAPDYVWYKWKGDVYIGDGRPRPRSRAKAVRLPRPMPEPGETVGHGWGWSCPRCARPVRVLYLPMPPINLLAANPAARDAEALLGHDDAGRWTQRLACMKCHRVHYLCRVHADGWNELIMYLSGGLLYGSEVRRPAWFTPDRKRPYRPIFNRPAPRREHVKRRLLQGWRIARIAREMQVTWGAVWLQVKRILAAEGVSDRHELALKLGGTPDAAAAEPSAAGAEASAARAEASAALG